jgi:hypothetical protein
MPLAPPPPTNQDVSSRQFRDWFYSIYALIGKPGQTLGTMAYENANSVSITGGAIGGVGISGSTVDSTPIGSLNPSTGKFTSLRATGTTILDTLTGYLKGTSGTVSAVSSIPNTDITGLGTMSTQNANAVAITGGNIDGTTIGATTPASGAFTSNLTRDSYTVKPNCYIEAYDRTASITVNTTPTLLIPNTTLTGATGITYNNSTGVFTFAEEGDYSLSLSVNALSTSGNRVLYIYAEKNTGSGWVVNANSGKFFQLTSTQITQIVYSNSVHRVAGEQTRYWIYANNTNVTLQTQTLPSVTGVYVPAIRIQYS